MEAGATGVEKMAERSYVVPLWLRLWHWTNALLFLTLLVTGVSLHFATPESPLIPFAAARTVHNVAGIALSILYAALIVANAFTGNGRQFLPRPSGFAERLKRQQAFYASGIFKGEARPFPMTPERKFNPLQQIAYLAVVYGAMPVLIASGFLFMFPELAPDRLLGMGGLWPIAVVHYLIGLFLTVFLIGHVYMATAGETVLSEIKMMITGWHNAQGAHEPDVSKEQSNA
jgi:thiosulfate reductase cytochrome b subunit